MEEIWKDIVGFEKKYQVSNTGKVRSKDYEISYRHGKRIKKGKELKGFQNRQTHFIQVMLYDENGKNYLKYVHILVANAFLKKPSEEHELYVLHKNGDKTNNNVDNLFYYFKNKNLNDEYGIENKRVYLFQHNGGNNRYRYIIKQKTLTDAVVGIYTNFEDLEKFNFKRLSIMAASNNKYGPDKSNIYKNYKWEVIKKLNNYDNE